MLQYLKVHLNSKEFRLNDKSDFSTFYPPNPLKIFWITRFMLKNSNYSEFLLNIFRRWKINYEPISKDGPHAIYRNILINS